VPEAGSLEELNEKILRQCIAYGCWISDYMDCNYLIILNKQFMIYFI